MTRAEGILLREVNSHKTPRASDRPSDQYEGLLF
jgi:hypothetical protein